MACCVLMAAICCLVFGVKAWLAGAFGRAGAAQDWRLTTTPDKDG